MKKAIACILVLNLFQIVSIGQSDKFPKVPFNYVKIYLFNVLDSVSKPEANIWGENGFALTKIGNGERLDENELKALNRITQQDLSDLTLGLSKCFIPRHGFIYFDENHKPVASISICFECEKLVLFPNPYSDIEYSSSFSVKKALKQLDSFERLITLCKIPIFKNANLYKTIMKP